MSQHEKFDQLKQQFIKDAEAHLALVKNLSFDDLYTEKAGYILTNARRNTVTSSIQFSDFLTRKRLRYFDEMLERKKFA